MTHYLYRLFDRDADLLYVGITADPALRIQTHRRRKPWGHQIHRAHVSVFPTVDAAMTAERAVIEAEQPRHNVAFNRNGAAPRPPVVTRSWFLVRALDAEGRVLYVGFTRWLPTWVKTQRAEQRRWISRTARIHMSGPYEKPVLRERFRSARREVA